MFMFFATYKSVIFIWGIGTLSLAYVSIYYMRPWFIIGSVVLVGIAIAYYNANRTQSLQDIGLGMVIVFAFLAAVAVNAVWANILVLKHILNPAFYQEHAGNYLSLKFLYHFILPVFLLFMLVIHLAFPGESVLDKACFEGDVKTVERILKGGREPDADIPPYHNRTPMDIATMKGHLDLVRLLVKHGASANGGIITYLLSQGADPDSGLYGAIEGGHADMAKYLLDSGAAFDFYDLVRAFKRAETGDDEIVNLLLERRPGWHFDDKEAIRLLEYSMEAVQKSGRDPWPLRLVEILFESGLRANTHDDYLKSGLYITAKAHYLDGVNLFLKKGARVNFQNNVGETALYAACVHSDTYPIVKVLLEHGADPNLQDRHGDTALIKASHGGLDNVKILLAHGADVHKRGYNGKTALHEVSRFPSEEKEKIAGLLIKQGARINATDEKGLTPLMEASCSDTTGALVTLF